MSRIVRSIKNVTNGYSSSQVKVRNITANDESSPNTGDMQDLAELTFQEHEMFLIMDMIDKRINDRGKHWRHVLKSLVLLDYLVRFGSDGVIVWCRENLYIIKTLREFHHRDDSGKDVGGAIRARARDITELLSNPERLQAERGHRRRGNRPTRYRSNSDQSRSRSRANSSSSRARDNYDDDMQRAIELSKETAAQEAERRRMVSSQYDQDDLTRAMQISQQNGQDLFSGNLIDTSAAVPSYGASYATTGVGGGGPTEYDMQQYYLNQQQQAAAAQQAELQRQYDAQQLQLQQLEYQQQMYQQQLADQQRSQQQMEALQPLKTGSNNPFAAFNQQKQEANSTPAISSVAAQPAPQAQQQPTLRRHKSFSKEHTDQLDNILSMREAQADTFGNTGSARIPAQHTASYMVDSAGRGLTLLQTATGKQTHNTSNNPFMSQQYTGIATTQVQPAYTGYGFGNAGSGVNTPQRTNTSTSLIDM